MQMLLLVLWSALSLHVIEASHFFGGVIMLRPADPQSYEKEIEITFQEAIRNDGDCDDSVVANQILLWGQDVYCTGCTESFSIDERYYCTDFSDAENWNFGYRILNYNFSANDEIVTVHFSGGNWLYPYSDWNIPTTINLTRRSDIGRINSTPRIITAPIINLQDDCQHIINLGVSDPDNDDVRCRWAVGFDECGSVCGAFPGAVLHENCTITYDAVDSNGTYVAALIVEDFLPGTNTNLSSVAVQFVVFVVDYSFSCDSRPTFTSATAPSGACISIPPNANLNLIIEAHSGVAGVSIAYFLTVGPFGLIKSAISPSALPDTYQMSVTWSPLPWQLGQSYLLCFTAVNSLGLSSTQRCITIMAGFAPPIVIHPQSLTIDPTNPILHMEFDQPVQRSTIPAKMVVKDCDTDAVYGEVDFLTATDILIYNLMHLNIPLHMTLPGGKTLCVELDGGALLGFGCGLESIEASFNFTTPDVLVDPPVTTAGTPGTNADPPMRASCHPNCQPMNIINEVHINF